MLTASTRKTSTSCSRASGRARSGTSQAASIARAGTFLRFTTSSRPFRRLAAISAAAGAVVFSRPARRSGLERCGLGDAARIVETLRETAHVAERKKVRVNPAHVAVAEDFDHSRVVDPAKLLLVDDPHA